MAVAFEEAKKIAEEKGVCFDTCYEFENAYSFSDSSKADAVGGPGHIVIMKDNGKALGYTTYIVNGYVKGKPKKHPLG